MKRVPRRRAGLAQGATALLLLAALALQAEAREVIPPAPSNYFHDDTGVVSLDAAGRLNETLAQFERETSKRLFLVVYPRMQSDSYVGDYVERISRAWPLAANSAVFFIFIENKKTFLVAGADLRSAFRDDAAIDLASRVMASPLSDADYEKAFSLGEEAMIRAVRDQQRAAQLIWPLLFVLPLGVLAVWRFRKSDLGKKERAALAG